MGCFFYINNKTFIKNEYFILYVDFILSKYKNL